MIFESRSLSDTKKIACKILKMAKSKVILLSGPLGAGKTTLVKKIGEILKIKTIINSPTFVIMKSYSKLIHIDAYRLNNSSLDEYVDFFKNKWIVIEWPENINWVFDHFIQIKVFRTEDNIHIYKVVKNV